VTRQSRDFVSIVLPAHNEADNILPMYRAITQVVAKDAVKLELIFVDDGSNDRTALVVEELASQDERVRLITFTRNFGHQAALLAGLEAARGDAVITMDCDLQHPPSLIPDMIRAWQNGIAVVQMIRDETSGISFAKRLTSALFYRVIATLSDTSMVPGGADFQLLDRSVLNALLSFEDRHPFLRGMTAWLGYPCTRLHYVAPPRINGRSAYSYRRMINLAVDAITAFSTVPLRVAFYTGCLSGVLALVYLSFITYRLIVGDVVDGWVSLMVVLLFLGTAQLMTLGIIGEYIGRIYDQTLQRPRYVTARRTAPATVVRSKHRP
jgi:polyisoprenyl-phosphate glycosyltransferase